MKRWRFKHIREPDCYLVIDAMNYDGAFSKLMYLINANESIANDSWEIDEMLKID